MAAVMGAQTWTNKAARVLGVSPGRDLVGYEPAAVADIESAGEDHPS
jgi:hypothetical protein